MKHLVAMTLYVSVIAGTPSATNKKLKADTYYIVFIRAYVEGGMYQSSGWYFAVITAPVLGMLIHFSC